MAKGKQSVALKRLKQKVELLSRQLATIQTALINAHGDAATRSAVALERIATLCDVVARGWSAAQDAHDNGGAA